MALSPAEPLKEVGPGHPPEHSRFKPGVSGNPKGRPPKKRDFKGLVEEELDQTVWITENGKRIRLTKREIIVKKLVNEAAKGDAKSLATLVKLVGSSPAEEVNPFSSADPAEVAAFVARYLPATGGGSK